MKTLEVAGVGQLRVFSEDCLWAIFWTLYTSKAVRQFWLAFLGGKPIEAPGRSKVALLRQIITRKGKKATDLMTTITAQDLINHHPYSCIYSSTV